MEEQLLQCPEAGPALRTPLSSVLGDGCSASITNQRLEALSLLNHGPPLDTGRRMYKWRPHISEDIAVVSVPEMQQYTRP